MSLTWTCFVHDEFDEDCPECLLEDHESAKADRAYDAIKDGDA